MNKTIRLNVERRIVGRQRSECGDIRWSSITKPHTLLDVWPVGLILNAWLCYIKLENQYVVHYVDLDYTHDVYFIRIG